MYNVKKDTKFQKPPRPKMDFAILGRVLGHIFKKYKFRLAIVIFCIILSTLSFRNFDR